MSARFKVSIVWYIFFKLSEHWSLSCISIEGWKSFRNVFFFCKYFWMCLKCKNQRNYTLTGTISSSNENFLNTDPVYNQGSRTKVHLNPLNKSQNPLILPYCFLLCICCWRCNNKCCNLYHHKEFSPQIQTQHYKRISCPVSQVIGTPILCCLFSGSWGGVLFPVTQEGRDRLSNV